MTIESLFADIPSDWSATLAFGQNYTDDSRARNNKQWTNKKITLKNLLDLGDVASHAESKSKDGSAYLQGSLKKNGRATGDNMDALSLIGFDVDNGSTFDETYDRLAQMGMCFAAHTTFSHQQNKNGVVCDRFRVLIPLLTPMIADQKKWEHVYRTIGDAIGLPFDPSCVNVNRLFYLPRHAAGQPFASRWNAGKAIDWQRIDLPTGVPAPARKGATAETSESEALLMWLKSWAARGYDRYFLPSSVLDGVVTPDGFSAILSQKVFGNGADGAIIHCPFDAEHTEPRSVNGADSATHATDADGEHGFSIKCKHASCVSARNDDRLAFLSQMIIDGWFSVLELINADHYIEMPNDMAIVLSAAESALTSAVGGKFVGFVEHDHPAIADLLRINQDFAKVDDEGGTEIYRLTGNIPMPWRRDSFVLKYKHERIPTGRGDGTTSTGEAWINWPGCRRFKSVVFEPGWKVTPPDVLNIWRGLDVTPREGDWSRLKAHIFEVICRGDVKKYEWLMSWMANLVREPGNKTGTAVAIRGKPGSGKSMLGVVLSRIIGEKYTVTISNENHLVGRFNSHLGGKILLCVEESFWAGDKKAEGVLKDMITGTSGLIEQKGFTPKTYSNHVRCLFTSNESWMLPCAMDDRRFFVLSTDDRHANKREWFDPIWQEIENGGVEAFAYELMNWKQPEWVDLRRPPKTDERAQQVYESLTLEERFFVDAALTGEIQTKEEVIDWDDDQPLTIATRVLYQAYCEALVSKYAQNQVHFGRAMRRCLDRPEGGKDVRVCETKIQDKMTKKAERAIRLPSRLQALENLKANGVLTAEQAAAA